MARNFRYLDFTGGLNNVSTVGTINQSPRRTESPDMMNVEYYKLGGIKTMEGNTQVGDTQVDDNDNELSIIGGWEYMQGNNRYLLIMTEDGQLKEYNNLTKVFNLIYKFPTPTERASFCNMNNGVVITNGVDDLLFYDKGRFTPLQGVVDTTIGSDEVLGTGTRFGVDVVVGDSIRIGQNTYFVSAITDETHLTIDREAEADVSQHSFSLSELTLCNAELVDSDDPNKHVPIRGLAINTFCGRLIVGSGNGLYYSELGKPNGWDEQGESGAGVIQSFYNDMSDIKALGLYASYLVIHKEFASYLLSGPSPTEWTVSPFASISCDSQQSYVQTNTRYYVYSKENIGIYPLLQHTSFTDKNLGQDISRNVRNIFMQVDNDACDKIFAVRHPKKRYMIFYMPSSFGNGSSLGVVFDFQTKTWLLRLVPQNVTIAFEYNDNVYIGTRDGKILREFSGKTFDNEPINAYWKSPWFTFGDDTIYKSIEEFCITLADDDECDFYFNAYRNGGNTSKYRGDQENSEGLGRRINTSMLDTSALVWIGTLNDDNNNTTWDNNNWVSSGKFGQFRFPTEQSFFREYQIEFSTKKSGQAFSIIGFGFNRVEAEEAPW